MNRSTPRPRRRLWGALPLCAVGVMLAALSGCAAPGITAVVTPSPSTAALSADLTPLGDGFLGDNPSPSPEATVTPEDGSWDGVEAPEGYRAVLITSGTDAATTVLVSAVREWAERDGVVLDTTAAAHDDEVEDAIDDAVASGADLVLGAGSGVIDVFALITGQYLDQQFLIVGAELPEPTENVTSVVWPGATFRGTGLSAASDQDVATFTPERASRAVSAGVASVLHGVTGIVIALA